MHLKMSSAIVICCRLSYLSIEANIVDTDQTAPVGPIVKEPSEMFQQTTKQTAFVVIGAISTFTTNNTKFIVLLNKPMSDCQLRLGLNIFIHISIYSNIQIYILQYSHDGIQKKVMRLIRICFPLNIKVHSLKL